MDAPRTGRYGTASPAPDGLRVGDAERDEVVAALREHFAEGRLDREEFDERLGRALTARTHADLRALLSDLPGSSAAPEAPEAARSQPGPGAWPWAPFGAWDDARRAWQDACARAWDPARHPARRDGSHPTPWGPPWAHRPHRHHPPFPLALFVVLGFAALVAGTAWPLIAALKIWVIFMIVWGVAAVARRHHRHHHRHR